MTPAPYLEPRTIGPEDIRYLERLFMQGVPAVMADAQLRLA
jgi:hypothetical protein